MSRSNTIEQFWNKVNKNTINGCWEWTGKLSHDGYGGYQMNKQWMQTHRWSMKLTGQNIEGKTVCHKCDNPRCVNPDHLFLGSQADNIKDMHDKKRYRAINTKLSKDDIDYIKTSGLSLSQLSKKFNISTCYASNIRNGIANPGAWKEKI